MEVLAHDAPDALERAVAMLDAGDAIVVPGDLRYFVVADALDDVACERLFEITRRGADRPLTVFVSGQSDLHHVAYGGRGPLGAEWPGPSLVRMRPRPWLPDAITAGDTEVRVGAPAQPVLQEIARQFGPLAAASARLQGQPDSLDAATAAQRLGGSVRLLIDAGPLPGGEEPIATPQQG